MNNFYMIESLTLESYIFQVETEGLSHKDFAGNCGKLAESVMAMINEDFVILHSGIFKKVSNYFVP